MRLARALGRATSSLAPGVAAAIAEERWFRPPRPRVSAPPPEAEVFSLTVRKRHLVGYTVGSGDPVLMLHGWGGDPSDLGAIARQVGEAGLRAVVPLMPGHGNDGGRRSDLFAMTAVVGAAQAVFGPSRAVVAHSFGAQTAAAAFPRGGPRRLVLVAPAIRPLAMLDGFGSALGLSAEAMRRLRSRIERFGGPQMLAIMGGEVDVPGTEVLVIHDPMDRFAPFADVERYARTRPHLTLRPVDGVGHHKILHHPDVVAVVTEFVTVRDRPSTEAISPSRR